MAARQYMYYSNAIAIGYYIVWCYLSNVVGLVSNKRFLWNTEKLLQNNN